MLTIHLVYPHGNKISTPDAIGRNIAKNLSSEFEVKCYDWSSSLVIVPEPGDILLGHAHPNPFTVFRLSMKHSGWGQVVLMQPFTTTAPHVAYLEWVMPYVTKFAAITGKYWERQLVNSDFSAWNSKFFRLDLAVDPVDFPRIKFDFNNFDNRRFLYIGNADKCKNLGYLAALANRIGRERFATIGARVNSLQFLGTFDFSLIESKQIVAGFDFLIITSSSDANPTVVLEAMSWGLIPVCTPQCGYTEDDGVIVIPHDDLEVAAARLLELANIPAVELQEIQRRNYITLFQKFSWSVFCGRLRDILNSSTSEISVGKFNVFLFFSELCSDRFFLRPKNISSFLRSNFKNLICGYLRRKVFSKY